MTPEDRNKYIADCCDGFKRQLDRADRIPSAWDCAEIQQWIMDTARDAWTLKMTPARKASRPDGKTGEGSLTFINRLSVL